MPHAVLVMAGVMAVLVVWKTGVLLVVVNGNSMAPTLRMGDLLIIQKTASARIGTGDALLYRDSPSGYTVHRVVRQGKDGRGRYFMTRGDANDTTDPRPVRADQAAGKVFLKAPGVGRVVWLARSGLGFFLLVVAPAFMLAWPTLQSAGKKARAYVAARRSVLERRRRLAQRVAGRKAQAVGRAGAEADGRRGSDPRWERAV